MSFQDSKLLKNLKKVISIILLGIFLFNIAGYYMVFEIMLKKVRTEMQNKLTSPGEKYTVIEIPDAIRPDQFFWIQTMEFNYEGELYDVVRMEKKSHSTIFYCLNDKNEEDLLRNFQKDSDSRNLLLLNSLCHIVLQAIPNQPSGEKIFLPSQVLHFSQLAFSLKSVDLNTFSPPPES